MRFTNLTGMTIQNNIHFSFLIRLKNKEAALSPSKYINY